MLIRMTLEVLTKNVGQVAKLLIKKTICKTFLWKVALKTWPNHLVRMNRFFHGESFLYLKGAPSGLRQILATESAFKMMNNAFYFTSKAFLLLKIFKFLSRLFGHVEKQLD